ncbi:hypothetical protein BJY00DRAFT_153758 [Aspergillus carlsbadensis]|nr:hypothetical protein BJY00DRAFT_153758 [Aspergillus carlsbadensis]
MKVSNLRLIADVDLLAASQSNARSAIVLVAWMGGVAMGYSVSSDIGEPTRAARFGGWGPLLGDEGAAMQLGERRPDTQ